MPRRRESSRWLRAHETPQRAAVGHGLDGIADQVEEDLAQFDGESVHLRRSDSTACAS